MVALLIDPEGYILSITGNRLTLNEARKINFVEGACWTEEKVGTNAIGTALQTEEPIMITGTEHYSIASHQWSCSAAPVRNDDGNLIGIINISCPVNRAHPYTLGMVTSIAYTIERELSIRMHKDEIELVHASMNFVDSKQLLLLCNYKEVIVDKQNRAGMYTKMVRPAVKYDCTTGISYSDGSACHFKKTRSFYWKDYLSYQKKRTITKQLHRSLLNHFLLKEKQA